MVTMFDVKQAALRLYKDKKYTFIILISISLGLAISLFLYAQVHTRLFTDLPFVDGDKIVYASRYERDRQRLNGGLQNYDVHYFQQRQTTLDVFTIVEDRRFTIATESSTHLLMGIAASSGLFELASEPPLLGRTFLPSDDLPHAAPVLVISYSVWQRLFQGDPTVIGKSVNVDGKPVTLVGVMNKGFHFPVSDSVWLSYVPAKSTVESAEGWTGIIGKLKPGISVQQADQEFKQLAAELERDYSTLYRGKSVKVETLTRVHSTPVLLLTHVMTVVAISVLLMSCFSVISLITVRMLNTAKEAAIKNAIGIPARQIVILPLVESIFLYAVAGAIGLLLCAMAIKYASGYVVTEWDPFWWKLSFNKPIICSGLAILCIAWVITGIVPVIMATNKRFYRQLNSGKKGGVNNQAGKLMNFVVALQVACTFVLMLFTGIALSSFYNVLNIDYGFNSKNFLISYVLPPPSKYEKIADRNNYFEKLHQQVNQIPGVKQVSFAHALPGTYGYLSTVNSTETDLSQSGGYLQATEIPISENHFENLGAPLLEGRLFTYADNESSESVVIVAAALAKKLSPNGSAIGKKMHLNPDKNGPLLTIVGVAPDLLYGQPVSFFESPMETIYRPMKQVSPSWAGMWLVVKTETNPYEFVDKVLQSAHNVDAEVALDDPESMEYALYTNASRFERLLYNFMPATLLAFIMSALSIYAISARAMLHRTNDIGIMKALGLQDQRITRLFMRDTYIKLGAGLLLGAVCFVLFLPSIMSQLIVVSYWSIIVIAISVTLVLSTLVIFASRIPLLQVHKLSPQEAINKV
ncbi:MAG TPA: ABC transporter permease [Cellvibrio sp.]|nr:ABC transporter permease [Cellvibrio sp.]